MLRRGLFYKHKINYTGGRFLASVTGAYYSGFMAVNEVPSDRDFFIPAYIK